MSKIYGTKITWPTYCDDFDDNLDGTWDNDWIYGLGGNDHIWGGGGHDVLVGGEGNDVIRPEFSDGEWVVGSWGNDLAYGGPGNDTLDFRHTTSWVNLWGESGNDFIFGGSSGDLIHGGPGIDILYGFDGHDYFRGGSDGDTVYAGLGNDTVYGDEGNDSLFGDQGDDTIEGGAGNDKLYGGYGNDIFQFRPGDEGHGAPPVDLVWDFIPGQDKISFSLFDSVNGYAEHQLGYNAGFAAAQNWAAAHLNGATHTVFVADGVNGYLFHSTDNVNDIEISVVLEDVAHVTQFGLTDFV